MPTEDLLRLNKFELCLMLLRQWDELEPIRHRLSVKDSWASAISAPQTMQSMHWLDFNDFKRQVSLQVPRFLKNKNAFGLNLRIIVCDQFEYCAKTGLPVGVLLAGIAKALSDSLPADVANIITAILFSHDILRALCECVSHLSPGA